MRKENNWAEGGVGGSVLRSLSPIKSPALVTCDHLLLSKSFIASRSRIAPTPVIDHTIFWLNTVINWVWEIKFPRPEMMSYDLVIFCGILRDSVQCPEVLSNVQSAVKYPEVLSDVQSAVHCPEVLSNVQSAVQYPEVLSNIQRFCPSSRY